MTAVFDPGHLNPMFVLGAIVLVVVGFVSVRQLVKRAAGTADDMLTFVVAGMATATSAQGMWKFFGDSLGVKEIYLRVLMFGMFEAAMLVCALRTRRAIKEGRPAGIEGPAVWVMAGLSGILAATDAGGFGAALARLAAPLVAAFLWERGLTAERQRAGKAVIHWRWTPERILVRLGVAEATDRTVSDVDAHRRITRVARAAKALRTARAAGVSGRKLIRAQERLDATLDAAVEHAGLATDPSRHETLMAQVGVLFNASALAELSPPAPWYVRTDAPAHIRTEDAAPPVRPVRTDEAPPVRTEPVRTPRTDVDPPVRKARTEPKPPVRTEPVRKSEPRTDDAGIDRDELVRDLARQIRAAVAADEKWSPDYDELMRRTGRKRSWCEKVVGDAKRSVFPTDDDDAAAALLGLRTPPRTGSVNGHRVASVGGA